jgi:hypothetical protein
MDIKTPKKREIELNKKTKTRNQNLNLPARTLSAGDGVAAVLCLQRCGTRLEDQPR